MITENITHLNHKHFLCDLNNFLPTEVKTGIHINAIDPTILSSPISIKKDSKNYFLDWTHRFHEFAFSQEHQNQHSNILDIGKIQVPSPRTSDKNILIAYSLGGRLALHCLCESNLWDGAILISAHPGFDKVTEKKEREKNDSHWASRFENEPWQDVILKSQNFTYQGNSSKT